MTSGRVPSGDSPVFHVVGAESLSAADLVKWAFRVRDVLHGEHDASKDPCRGNQPRETLPVDDRNDAPGMVAADRPESPQERAS